MHVKAGQSHNATRETMPLHSDLITPKVNASQSSRTHCHSRVLGIVCDMVGLRGDDLQIVPRQKKP